jgi:hypothetical protein
MIQLQDADPMPFGKYKGDPMEDVPAGYLNWLWNEDKHLQVKTCPVADYISRNIGALTKEAPDLLWDKEAQ